jgi:hypothetical protein
MEFPLSEGQKIMLWPERGLGWKRFRRPSGPASQQPSAAWSVTPAKKESMPPHPPYPLASDCVISSWFGSYNFLKKNIIIQQ